MIGNIEIGLLKPEALGYLGNTRRKPLLVTVRIYLERPVHFWASVSQQRRDGNILEGDILEQLERFYKEDAFEYIALTENEIKHLFKIWAELSTRGYVENLYGEFPFLKKLLDYYSPLNVDFLYENSLKFNSTASK